MCYIKITNNYSEVQKRVIIMERNSVIVECLEKLVFDRLPRTRKYNQSFDEMCEQAKEFLKLIDNDKQLVKKFLAIESTTSANQFEYESMCFCEGVRLGFKLCMDLFEI